MRRPTLLLAALLACPACTDPFGAPDPEAFLTLTLVAENTDVPHNVSASEGRIHAAGLIGESSSCRDYDASVSRHDRALVITITDAAGASGCADVMVHYGYSILVSNISRGHWDVTVRRVPSTGGAAEEFVRKTVTVP